MKSQNRMKSRRSKNARRGFAVIEIMVSMIVMSIGLLGVAGMTVAASRRATVISVQSTRDGIVLQELNRLAALPYDSLASRAGCTTVASTTLPYSRCITVTDITGGSGYKRVELIVSPTTAYARADTVYLNRAKGAPKNPLAQ
jgi:prepilin-type N-terminal cleavage/methylation domain-containing protein